MKQSDLKTASCPVTTKISILANEIYLQAIEDYHIENNLDQPMPNIYPPDSLSGLLYSKCWIDTVQWHLEDEIRKIDLSPVDCLVIKRRIDKSNQERTNIVELLDDYFIELYNEVKPHSDARINTESPAWALDRLSILDLKIYHMQVELERSDSTENHLKSCALKLDLLRGQFSDLSNSIDELQTDIATGIKKMKVYRQVKMYNDPSLNPVLYNSKIKNNWDHLNDKSSVCPIL